MKKITNRDVAMCYVKFIQNNKGKKRPIFVIDSNEDDLTFFNITSKYSEKSDKIREKYVPLFDWKDEGLSKPSYVDLNTAIKLKNNGKLGFKFIGELTEKDINNVNNSLKEFGYDITEFNN